MRGTDRQPTTVTCRTNSSDSGHLLALERQVDAARGALRMSEAAPERRADVPGAIQALALRADDADATGIDGLLQVLRMRDAPPSSRAAGNGRGCSHIAK
jgi:hypothetical protein